MNPFEHISYTRVAEVAAWLLGFLGITDLDNHRFR